MGDRVVVLDKGEIQQVGTPLEIYRRPANKFVAGFIGSPPMNFFEIKFPAGDKAVLEGGFFTLPLTGVLTSALQAFQGEELWLGIRPENIHLVPEDTGITATLEVNELLGNESNLYLRAGEQKIVVRSILNDLPEPGSSLNLNFDPDHFHIFRRSNAKRIN